MARIQSYELDTTISNEDYLLGNDVDSTSAIATKRFALEDLRTFFIADTVTDILNTVPGRHIPVVNQAGDGIERAPIEITHAVTSSDILLSVDGDLDGATVRYAISQNGVATLRFENFDQPYYLEGFVGNDISFTTTLSGNLITHTGSITSYDGYEQDDNDIYDTFTITTDPVLTEATNLLLSLTISGGTELTINVAGLTIQEDLTVLGDSNFGTDASRTEIEVHGLVQFHENGEGLLFGPVVGDSPGMSTTTMTVDSNGNLIITGADLAGGDDFPDWIFDPTVDVNIQGNTTLNTSEVTNSVNVRSGTNLHPSTTITPGSITTTIAGGSAGPSLVLVTANNNTDVDTTRTEQLSSVQIGGGTYQLPELSAGVAEALPGLTEDLEGSAVDFTTGTFFYGIEQSTGAAFRGTPTDLTGIAITALATSIDLGDDGDAAVTAFETFRDARGDFMLFFVQSDYSGTDLTTLATDGTVIIADTENVYEVVAYDGVTNIVTFSKLGEGTIRISTNSFSVTSEVISLGGIPTEAFDQNTHNFVTIDTDDELSKSALNISGSANGARFTDTRAGGQTDQAVSTIEFTGHNASGDSAGAIVVDTTGRYTIRGEITASTDLATIEAGDAIVLRACTTAQTLTLPTGIAGDSIKIINTSTITDAGLPGATTAQWNISPNATQTIMGIGTSDPLDLDDPTASFELLYTGGVLGWTLIGIN